MRTITYDEANADLGAVKDRAAADRAPVMITCQGGENIVLVSASEWADMLSNLESLSPRQILAD